MHSSIRMFLVALLFSATCSFANTNTDTGWVSRFIQDANPKLTQCEVEVLSGYLVQYAAEFNLDLHVYVAMVKVESRFRHRSSSPDGAVGLVQFIPKYHKSKIHYARKRLGVDNMYDPKLNLYVGAWILSEYVAMSSSMRNGLLRYNGSLGNRKGEYARKVLAEAALARKYS